MDALNAACGPTTTRELRGPWRRGTETYFAGLSWSERAKNACLVLMSATSRSVRVQSQAWPVAGWSERYHERYAPKLEPVPIFVTGLAPFPVTRTRSQGDGGGGGDMLEVWGSRRTTLTRVLFVDIDGFTNINTMVEHVGECTDSWKTVANVLVVESCFDGRATTHEYAFGDGQFTLR